MQKTIYTHFSSIFFDTKMSYIIAPGEKPQDYYSTEM